MMSKKCKIIVCYHKPSRIFNDPMYLPVNAGRALLERKYNGGILSLSEKMWLYQNTVGDDTGDNISDLNYSFCELTAIYWAWKNYEKIDCPDYVGLCHYRRIFDVDSKSFDSFIDGNHIIYAGCNDLLASSCDSTIAQQFLQCHKDDLKKCLDYFENNNISFYTSFVEYLSLPFKKSALFNMFIVQKDIFFEYCELLFSVLFHIVDKINISSYSQYGSRVFGFLAERITGAFFYHKHKQGLKVKRELPFLFEERFIKISIENVWAENIDITNFIGSNIVYQNEKDDYCIVIPMNSDDLDLTLSTIKACLSSLTSKQKYHIFLLSNADLREKKTLIAKIKDKFEYFSCINQNLSMSLIILSESCIEEFKSCKSFSKDDLQLLKIIKKNPSLWFLLLNDKILAFNNIFWVNSGYIANDDFLCLAEKYSVSEHDNLIRGISGCESLYSFIVDNDNKSLSDIQIDFSLPIKYLQTNLLYINLNWLSRYRLTIARNLVEFNGFYAINTCDFRNCVNIIEYYWSVEIKTFCDYSSSLDRRLSFENYMKFSSCRYKWQGAFVSECAPSSLKNLGIM